MLKVLIVDDEPLVLEGLRTMIDWEQYGFEVCAEAQNGVEAMDLIQEYKPHLVLTDINMPVINGLELIAKSNETMENPPKFVVLTGYDDFKYARTALRQRVNEYLLKPIDDEEIEALLNRITPIIKNEIASNEKIDKKKSFIINNIINRLIQGEYNENLELLSRDTTGFEIDAELQCILTESNSFLNPFHSQVDEYFPKNCFCFFQDGLGRAGIILQSNAISIESLEWIVDNIRSDVAKQSLEPVIVAISSRMIGMRSIREIYLQALDVWNRNTHKQKSGVFYYSELRRINREVLSEAIFKQLLDRVGDNDRQQIQSCVTEAFSSFVENRQSIEGVQVQVAHLELTLCRLIAQMNGDPNSLMTKIQLAYGNLGDLSDYLVLSRYVHSLSTQAAEYLSELKQQNENNTIYNVIQYVDNEFRNKLKLQDLSRQFHINATYLGQLFRKQTGQGFSEYLNEKRIEESKSLLKRTQLKITDIALQVGFSNTDYFIDKFKMIVGVVPSVYRNENKNHHF